MIMGTSHKFNDPGGKDRKRSSNNNPYISIRDRSHTSRKRPKALTIAFDIQAQSKKCARGEKGKTIGEMIKSLQKC
jgi:hypothetical protein